MDTNALLLIVLGVVLPLLVAALFYLMPLLEKQIHTRCQQAADDLGLEYLATQDSAILRPLASNLEILARCPGQLTHVIRGEIDDAVIFTFPLVLASDDEETKYTDFGQAVLIYSEKLQLPKFQLMPRAIGDSLDRSHIPFKEHAKFSQHYLLKGENESQIRDVFSYQVLDFCGEQRPKVNIQANGSTLLCYYQGHFLTSPEKLKALVTSTQALYRLLR